MNNGTDRIITGMEYWNKREAELRQVFGNGSMASKAYLEEKLKYMETLRNGYKNQAITEAEKSSMKILKGEIKDLERSLYPNIAERLFRRQIRNARNFIVQRRAESHSRAGSTSKNASADPRIDSPNNTIQDAESTEKQNQQKHNSENLYNDNLAEQQKYNQKNDNRITNEYKKRLSPKNNFKNGKRIKHRH